MLQPDTSLVIPSLTNIRLLVTSSDVLHSYAIPSLALKCDAVPGRLNQAHLFILRDGSYYGQCSELCGAQHGFMPILIESTPFHSYQHYLH